MFHYNRFKPIFKHALAGQCRYPKISQHNHSQYNPVITKELEVMLAHIAHQELDGIDGYHERYKHAQDCVKHLRACEHIASHEIFYQL